MKRERLIKQLMAAKISRNDAAAFAKGYRAVKAAGMEHLFQELIVPPALPMQTVCMRLAPPMQATYVRPVRLRVSRAASSEELEGIRTIDAERYIKDGLARQLGRALAESGAVRFNYRNECGITTFFAEVCVLPPVGKEEEHERI